MEILISIKPEYTEKILNNTKHYELRRSFSKKEINKLIIYSTSPKSRVVWEVKVEKVIHKPIDELRNLTKDKSCVTKEFFYKYFKWKEYWYAIKLTNPIQYSTPKELKNYKIKRPPQNYCYIK